MFTNNTNNKQVIHIVYGLGDGVQLIGESDNDINNNNNNSSKNKKKKKNQQSVEQTQVVELEEEHIQFFRVKHQPDTTLQVLMLRVELNSNKNGRNNKNSNNNDNESSMIMDMVLPFSLNKFFRYSLVNSSLYD